MEMWVPIVLGAGALVVPFIVLYFERSKKSIAMTVLTNRPVVTSPKRFKLDITHAGRAVESPRLVVLRIANSGREPIRAEDFESPLLLRFGEATALSADVTKTRPGDLRPVVDLVDEHTLAFSPCLLNQNDLVEVQLLVDGDPSEIGTECRIAGVSRIDRVKIPLTSAQQPWRMRTSDFVLLGITVASMAVLASWFVFGPNATVLSRILGGLIGVFALVVFPYTSVRSIRRNRLFMAV